MPLATAGQGVRFGQYEDGKPHRHSAVLEQQLETMLRNASEFPAPWRIDTGSQIPVLGRLTSCKSFTDEDRSRDERAKAGLSITEPMDFIPKLFPGEYRGAAPCAGFKKYGVERRALKVGDQYHDELLMTRSIEGD